MSNTTSIKIQGLQELKNELKQFAPRVQKNILTSSIRAEASNVQKIAKKLAPKDTGNLKKSIKVKKRRTKNKNSIYFTVGLSFGKSSKNDGWYGRLVEFGTSKTKAQPFFRPAFDGLKTTGLQNIQKKMKQNIDKNRYKNNSLGNLLW